MGKLPIALQVYSVRDQAEQDFAGTMARVREMGYDGVELAGTYGLSVSRCKEILDKLGLALVCAHVPMDQLEDNGVLNAYAAAGMRYIAIPWMEAPADEEALAAAQACIQAIALRCRERGMCLLYHNHDFEFHKIGGKYILDAYYDAIPADLLKTELDTCWVNVGGEEPAAFVRKYRDRAPIVHLKDFFGSKTDHMYALIGSDAAKEAPDEAFEFRPLGYGRQNVPELVRAAEEAGAQWLVVEQDAPSMGKSSMECAKMSVDYLHSL